MTAFAYHFRRNQLRFSMFSAALMLGLALGIAIPMLSGQSLYRLVMVVMAAVSGFALLISGQPRRILLFCLMVAIPLNLAFSPLGDVAVHSGGAPAGLLIYLYDLPLVGLVVIWLLDISIHRAPIRFTAVDALAILFIAWSSLSMLQSTDLTLSLFEIARMIKLYLLAHVVGALVTSAAAVRAALLGLAGALLVQALVTPLQYFFNYDLGGLGFIVGDTHRVSGTVGWPNTLGAFAAAVMCVPLMLWLCKVGGRWRWTLLALSLLGALPLVLTFSRGGWVGLAAGMAVGIVLALASSWLTARSLSKLIVPLIFAGIVAIVFSGPIAERFAEQTISVRGDLNVVAEQMIAAHPLLGIGVNTFTSVMHSYDSSGVTVYFPEPVHNIFLLIAAETGLVGLGLFLALIGLTFRTGLQALRRGDAFLSVTVIGLLAGLTAILVSNLVDVHLRTDVIYSLFWVYIGLILAIRRLPSFEIPPSLALVSPRLEQAP